MIKFNLDFTQSTRTHFFIIYVHSVRHDMEKLLQIKL